MNKAMIASMREQLRPSEAARAALLERAGETPEKREGNSVKKYLAAAACAALLLCAYPAYNALRPQETPKLHSYITMEAGDLQTMKTQREEAAELTGEKGGGDRDQAMLDEELVEAMENAGFSTAEIDDYQALGYEMTWAKWWKYVHSAEEPDMESLKAFSDRELSINTGVQNDPVEALPAQPGADAYQLLMDHFGGALPDWYGGAYVTDGGTLMVLLVDDKNPGDKTLELEVLEAAGGRAAPVGFTSAKYSRNDLMGMNGEIGELLDGRGIFATWGIYDDQNRIVLDVAEPLSEELLAAIAKIDPGDDAILVRVVEERTLVTEQTMKGPQPIGEGVDPVPGGAPCPGVDAVDPEEGEDPAEHFATEPGGVVPDDEDLEAIEPYYDGGVNDLPQKRPGKVESAHHDLLPVEE